MRSDWNLRGLSVIAFAHGISDFFAGTVPFAIFLVVSRSGLSPVYQGALVFLWYLTSSIVQPFFGAYSDRHGRWWFLPSALLVTMTSLSIAAAVSSLWLLAFCIVLGGLGSAVLHPEAGKYSAMLSGSRRAGGISIFQVGGQIGFAFGPVVIALLYARFGLGGSLWLLIPGTIAIASVFAMMRQVDRSAVTLHGAAHAKALPAGPPDRFGVSLLVGSTALRHFTSAAFMTYLPNLLHDRGVSLGTSGLIVTSFLLVSIFGLMAGGSLSDRFGAVRISVVALCAAVPFLFGFFILGGPMAIGLLLLGNALLSVQNAPAVTIVQAMLPKNLGMALGLMNGVAFGLGSGLVAVLGIVVARASAATALEAVSATPLLAALSYVLVSGRVPRSQPSGEAARSERPVRIEPLLEAAHRSE